jgi:hypothetical protein
MRSGSCGVMQCWCRMQPDRYPPEVPDDPSRTAPPDDAELDPQWQDRRDRLNDVFNDELFWQAWEAV